MSTAVAVQSQPATSSDLRSLQVAHSAPTFEGGETQPETRPVEVSFERHNAFVGPSDLKETLVIIGVGATGSNLALMAAKMGFTNFVVYDHDRVEEHNLPNQAYDIKHVGMLKVDALKDVLLRFNPRINIQTHARYFTNKEDGDDVEGILIVAVDSMKARADILECFDGNPLISLVVESRLGFDFGQVSIIDPLDDRDITNFRNSLRDDSEVPEGPCGLRICTTTVNFIASYMVHQICQAKNHAKRGVDWQPKKKMAMNWVPQGVQTFLI